MHDFKYDILDNELADKISPGFKTVEISWCNLNCLSWFFASSYKLHRTAFDVVSTPAKKMSTYVATISLYVISDLEDKTSKNSLFWLWFCSPVLVFCSSYFVSFLFIHFPVNSYSLSQLCVNCLYILVWKIFIIQAGRTLMAALAFKKSDDDWMNSCTSWSISSSKAPNLSSNNTSETDSKDHLKSSSSNWGTSLSKPWIPFSFSILAIKSVTISLNDGMYSSTHCGFNIRSFTQRRYLYQFVPLPKSKPGSFLVFFL